MQGVSYRGSESTTRSGHTCLAWTENSWWYIPNDHQEAGSIPTSAGMLLLIMLQLHLDLPSSVVLLVPPLLGLPCVA